MHKPDCSRIHQSCVIIQVILAKKMLTVLAQIVIVPLLRRDLPRSNVQIHPILVKKTHTVQAQANYVQLKKERKLPVASHHYHPHMLFFLWVTASNPVSLVRFFFLWVLALLLSLFFDGLACYL